MFPTDDELDFIARAFHAAEDEYPEPDEDDDERQRDVDMQQGAFICGARWHAGHMAVCEFLSDLSWLYISRENVCEHCSKKLLWDTLCPNGCDR